MVSVHTVDMLVEVLVGTKLKYTVAGLHACVVVVVVVVILVVCVIEG